MKYIFDAIRAHFERTPRDYRDSHPILHCLAHFERGIRGFSNKLDLLTSLSMYGPEHRVLQATLRGTLAHTLSMLAYELSRQEEAAQAGVGGLEYETPNAYQAMLRHRDPTGYLRATAKEQLWDLKAHHRANDGQSFYGQPHEMTLTGSVLTFRAKIVTYGRTPGSDGQFLSEVATLHNIDLDSLGGAAEALLKAKRMLQKLTSQAQALPDYLKFEQKLQADEKAAEERRTRLRAAFKTLTAADRQYLKGQLHHTSPICQLLN